MANAKRKHASKTTRQCNRCAAYFDEKTIDGAVHLASCRMYNGWRNYETWNIALWIDNEQASYRYWRDAAKECRQAVANGEGNKYADSDAERVQLMLAERLKEEIRNGATDMLDSAGTGASMYADLLGAAFDECDWDAIASGLVEE